MAGTYHWVEMPPEVEEITQRLAAAPRLGQEAEALRAERRALAAAHQCEFGLAPLARLGTVQQMERLGMLTGSEEPPYEPLAADDRETDRHAYLRAYDRPAAEGIGRWKFATQGGGRVFPSEIAAALALVTPEEHQRAARQVVWWPRYVAFLRAAEAHGGFFT